MQNYDSSANFQTSNYEVEPTAQYHETVLASDFDHLLISKSKNSRSLVSSGFHTDNAEQQPSAFLSSKSGIYPVRSAGAPSTLKSQNTTLSIRRKEVPRSIPPTVSHSEETQIGRPALSERAKPRPPSLTKPLPLRSAPIPENFLDDVDDRGASKTGAGIPEINLHRTVSPVSPTIDRHEDQQSG